MKLGISTYTYTWAIGVAGYPPDVPISLLDLLTKASYLGVHVVQVADNLPLHSLSADDLAAVERRAQESHIAIEVGTRGIAPEHLLRYLQIAEQFHSPILRVVIDTAQHRPDVAEVIATLKSVMPDFERRDICLAIENHDRFSARTFAHIVQQVGGAHIGICLDTVNSFGALEGPQAVVDVLGEYVVNLHVKDFSIQRASHMMGFSIEGQPAGQGRLDVPWLLDALRALRRKGRDPNAILELWTPPGADLAATIAREAIWARESVDYLRRWISD